MYSKENLLKLKVINCKNYIYIADEDYYGVTDLTRYLFDGEVPEKTNKDRWFKLNSIPKVVAAKQEDKRINVRYELKQDILQQNSCHRLSHKKWNKVKNTMK